MIHLPGPLNSLAVTAKDTARTLRYRVKQTAEGIDSVSAALAAKSPFKTALKLAESVMESAESFAEEVLTPGRAQRHLAIELLPQSYFFQEKDADAAHEFVRYHYALIKRVLQFLHASNYLVFEQGLLDAFERIADRDQMMWAAKNAGDRKTYLSTALVLELLESNPVRELELETVEGQPLLVSAEQANTFIALFLGLAGLLAEVVAQPVQLEQDLALLAEVVAAELPVFLAGEHEGTPDSFKRTQDFLVELVSHLI